MTPVVRMHGSGRLGDGVQRKRFEGGVWSACGGRHIYGAVNTRNCEDGVECAGAFAENRASERRVAGVVQQRRGSNKLSPACDFGF